MAKFSVLLDACVLVPFTLADTLLRQAEADLYRPLWSRKILEEVQSAGGDVGRFADAARERLNRDVPPPSPATFAPPLFEW